MRTYEDLQMEIIKFDLADVITTSGEDPTEPSSNTNVDDEGED